MNKRRLISIFLVLSLVLSFSVMAWGSRPEIQPPEFRYDPPSRKFTTEGYPAVWLLKEEHDEIKGRFWRKIRDGEITHTEASNSHGPTVMSELIDEIPGLFYREETL